MNKSVSYITNDEQLNLNWFVFSKLKVIAILEKIISIGIAIILVFPLIGDYGNLLFPIGRDILLRFIVEIIGALFILLVFLNRSYFPKKNIIIWLYFAYWLICGITTIFSTQPQFSLWGNIFRGQGFFSQTHIFLLFLIVASFVKKQAQWGKAIWISVGVGVIVSVITTIEFFFNRAEAQSTLNNPNFLGMYLLFPIFLTVSLILNKENSKWRKILFITLALELVAAYLTNSRGTYAGVLIGFICIVFFHKLLPIFLALSKKKKIISVAFLLITSGLIISLFVKEIKAVDSFLKNPNAERIESRLIDWFRVEYYQTAIKGIKEKPLTGFGLENFTVSFDKYYRGTLDNQEWDNQWSDKTHNIFLEVGVTTGLFGLVVYLGMWIATFILLIKKIIAYQSKKDFSGQYWTTVGLLAVFSAYLMNNQLTIESTTNMAYSAVFLALAVFLSSSESVDPCSRKAIGNQSWGKGEKVTTGIIAAILLFAVIAINSKYNISELVANYRLNEGERYFAQMDYSNGFSKYESSLSVNNPAISSYLRHRYGRVVVTYWENSLIFGVDTDRQILFRAIELQEESANTTWPVFTRNWLLAGKLVNVLLEKTADPVEKIILKNQADIYFQKALNLSSSHGIIYLEWAKTDILNGNYALAEEKISQAEKINPQNGYLWWLRGIIAIKLKQNEIAEDHITKAQALGYKTLYPLSLAELGKIYDQMGSWDKSVEVYQKMNNLYSWNINGFLKLADAHHNLSENQKAIDVLQQALSNANTYYQKIIREKISAISNN